MNRCGEASREYRSFEKESEQAEHIADGFCYRETRSAHCEGKTIEWQEQRLVVQSLKQAAAQKKVLDARLDKAEQAIAALNLRGRGRKCLDASEMSSKASSILAQYMWTDC